MAGGGRQETSEPESEAATPRTQAARRGLGGYWNMFKEGYDELVNAICRPPRAQYRVEDLGPPEFEYGGVTFVREDCELTNPRGLKLQGSFWHRGELPEGGAPAVVYTHGNASCRAEALQILAPALSSGASVFAFDFAGCGQSEGDYISLGWHEKDDLAAALTHLRATGRVTAIMLWGRSMGASSAVLQASRDPSLAGLVLDSPFASLEQVALELVTSAPETVPGAPSVPPFLVKTALRVVAGTVKSRASFDLYKLRPVDAARTCFVPALFGCAADDVLVRPHHSQQIYDAYSGDKNLVKFGGGHNDLRPGFFNDSATIFLKQVLLISESAALDVPLDRDGRPLPIGAALRSAGRAGALRSIGGWGSQLGVVDGPGVSVESVEQVRMNTLSEYEDELMRQAILASLAIHEGPPQAAAADAGADAGADGARDAGADGARNAAARGGADGDAGVAAAGGEGGDVLAGGGAEEALSIEEPTEAQLLEAAIRMSLESNERETREREVKGTPGSVAAEAPEQPQLS